MMPVALERQREGSAAQGVARWIERDHLLVAGGIFGLIVLTWFDLLRRAGVFAPLKLGREMVMPQAVPWGPADAVVMGVMWIVMMAAMMLPSAAPMVLLFSRVMRKRGALGKTAVPAGIFLLGYLLIWTGFSLLATGAQWGLHRLVLLSTDMALISPLLGGVILMAAGVYQFTPLKQTCLTHCQSPLDFLGTHWRDGSQGALLMGFQHGGYCLGCCWVLMLLLFVGGVMNLTWIALLAGFVLLERVVTRGILISRVAGSLFVLWGLGLTLSELTH